MSKVATSGKLEPFPVSLDLRAAASGLKTNRRTITEAILGLFDLGLWALEENWKRSCNIICYNMHMQHHMKVLKQKILLNRRFITEFF